MKPTRILLAVTLCCAANSALAGHDLRASIQPLVSEITLQSHATVMRPLAVRIVDDDGQPLEGVKVWFDIAPCVPSATAACPPLTVYGNLDGKNSVDVLTDHAGVAAVGSFVGGRGTADYVVTAMVPRQAWRDKNLTQRGALATFSVHQHGDNGTDADLDGIYSSPARDGEGWEISLGSVGSKLFVVGSWFTFDELGRPLWLIGSGEYDTAADAAQLDLHSASGAKFGAAFNPSDVVRTRWGIAKLHWRADGGMQVDYTRQDGNAGTLSLKRIFPNR